MQITIMLELFLKTTNAQVFFSFLSRIPDMIPMGRHVEKQLDYIMIFYFYLIYFTFSTLIFCALISLSLFSNFSISIFICMFFLKLLSCVVEKLLCVCVCVYIYIHICICIYIYIYTHEFCLSKT